jgi:CHAT domain-containing protein
LLGDVLTLELRGSLVEILAPRLSAPAGGALLAIGFPAYDAATEPTPFEALLPGGGAQAGLLRESPWAAGFEPLSGTRDEVESLAQAHAATFGTDAPRRVLTGAAATREALGELAARTRWLHVATHGWFAPESIRSWNDAAPRDEHDRGHASGLVARVEGMSPMLLCGLALAGANRPADARGRNPGLVTAEELATFDLEDCELAVLSACDTNVGLRRVGQGVASLQKALHMAGARSVITSLWKVPDAATQELMTEFYRLLWIEKRSKAGALWEAKRKLRDARDASGALRHSMSDWAAWVLTGEPD